MKFVLNKCYGGFTISDWALLKLNIDPHHLDWENFPDRDDPDLIKLVEENAEKASGECAELKVVEIPDSATDYEFDDYDGIESITYVVDGKIYHA